MMKDSKDEKEVRINEEKKKETLQETRRKEMPNERRKGRYVGRLHTTKTKFFHKLV